MRDAWPYPDEEPDDGSEEEPEFVDQDLVREIRRIGDLRGIFDRALD